MPQIPENVINSVFYLYRTKDDALTGENPCGTGFIVKLLEPNTFNGHPFYYAITNWHVACGGGASVIRLNTTDGGTDIIEFDPSEWEFKPGFYDVAVIQLNLDDRHKVSAVDVNNFVRENVSKNPIYDEIEVGEDVFMIGLYVDHGGDGSSVNIPSARFGNISMLPDARAPIIQPTDHKGVSYLIDMRSRTGFSGSPVYVYRTFGSNLNCGSTDTFDGIDIEFDRLEFDNNFIGVSMGQGGSSSGKIHGSRGRMRYAPMLKLLGISWGLFPERWEIYKGKTHVETKQNTLVADGTYISGLSGMTCVIPAWHILEVLNLPALKNVRAKIVKNLDVNNKHPPIAG